MSYKIITSEIGRDIVEVVAVVVVIEDMRLGAFHCDDCPSIYTCSRSNV